MSFRSFNGDFGVLTVEYCRSWGEGGEGGDEDCRVWVGGFRNRHNTFTYHRHLHRHGFHFYLYVYLYLNSNFARALVLWLFV